MLIHVALQHLIARYLVAHLEVAPPSYDSGDSISAHTLFSVCECSKLEGVVAEIDQDGYIFAAKATDQPLFPTRSHAEPKRYRQLQLVVREDIVCVRKTFPPLPKASLAGYLHNDFFVEAAAMLRLQGSPYVPRLRNIDVKQCAIEMDYINGQNLRNIYCESMGNSLGCCSDSLDDTEPELRLEISKVLTDIVNRGIAPRDIHRANFIRSHVSGRLYMVDFHLSWLRPISPFFTRAKELRMRFK